MAWWGSGSSCGDTFEQELLKATPLEDVSWTAFFRQLCSIAQDTRVDCIDTRRVEDVAELHDDNKGFHNGLRIFNVGISVQNLFRPPLPFCHASRYPKMVLLDTRPLV
jgi:hypothetical protein